MEELSNLVQMMQANSISAFSLADLLQNLNTLKLSKHPSETIPPSVPNSLLSEAKDNQVPQKLDDSDRLNLSKNQTPEMSQFSPMSKSEKALYSVTSMEGDSLIVPEK